MPTSVRRWLGLLVVLLIAAGAVWFVRNHQRQVRIDQAFAEAPQRLRDFTANFPAVYFVSVEGDTLTFSWAEQIKRDDGTYIEQVYHEGMVIEPGVYRATKAALAYSDLTPGQEIRLDMIPDPADPTKFLINAAYLLE